jgi:hypothetical protein
MKRRKYLLGFGSLVAGSAAALGTGAFSSGSIPDRQVTAKVDSDVDAQIALIPGEDPDVSLDDGEITLDLTGSENQGVNINSRYTWGDHDNPTDDYAFAIVNNDELNYDTMAFTYILDDASWLQDDWESFIKFTVYRDGWASKARRFPNPYEPEKSTTENVDSGMIFDSGETWPVVVDVDTTVDHAEITDDLSGILKVDISGPTDSGD